MAYREHEAPSGLERHVELIWTHVSDDRELHRIAPDGRCEVIVHLGEPYLEQAQGRWAAQPVALFAGQLTRPLHLRGNGPMSTISARLAPSTAGAFLGQDASASTDQRVPLGDIDPNSQPLAAMLRGCSDEAQRVRLFGEYLVARFASSPLRPDPRVGQAIARIEASDRPDLGTIALGLNISARQLERLFRIHVGIPAGTYCSIIRFRRLFDLLSGGERTWSDAAAEAGYSDHPQMAREFQRFLGCSATEFIRDRAHLAAAMTQPRAH